MLVQTGYHDGTIETSLITDTVNPARECRTWKLAARMTAAQLSTLQTFWETAVQGGFKPFYYYDPFDVVGSNPIGSNYDATGTNTQGRAVVRFKGDWKMTGGITLNDVPELSLEELA
jgi:hypothetical protein